MILLRKKYGKFGHARCETTKTGRTPRFFPFLLTNQQEVPEGMQNRN